MDRNNKSIGLVNWIVLLATTVVSSLVATYVSSTAGMIGSVVFGLALLVGLVSYFQMRLEDRDRLEKLEFDELNKSKGSAALFTAEAESFPAQRSREQFERFFVPVFTIILFLAEVAAIVWHWKFLEKDAKALIPERALVGAALYGLLFLILFLFGKYSSRLAQLENERLLRASSGFVLLSSYVALALAATVAFGAWGGYPRVDIYVARTLTIVLGLIAAETVVSLLLEIYRPRLKGQKGRVLYESRLAGLLGQPEGIFKTAAQALDYQFGFKVSETWFYRFLEKAFAWLVLVQIAVLALSTCFVFVETGEQALLERFGRPIKGREVLGAGLHLKLPFPIDRVHRFRTEEIQSFTLGAEKGEEEEHTAVWSVAHEKEENMLVASREPVSNTSTNNATGKKSPPVNLLSVSIPVQYQITNLTDWAYNNTDGSMLLTNLAMRELVRYLVSADLIELMSRGRADAAHTLRERIQAAANERHLGVNIIFVGLEDTHPPVAVAAEYERVVGAIQTRVATNLAAQAFAIETNALARAEAFKKRNAAEAERVNLEVAALARAALFTNQLPAYQASPTVYAQRRYLAALKNGTKNARKYVIATTNTEEVISINLEDKLRPDLLDIGVPPAK